MKGLVIGSGEGAARRGRGHGTRRRELLIPAVLAGIALVLSGVPGGAQEAGETAEPSELERVLSAHHEARGGLERLRSISTVRVTATLVMPGMEAPFTVLMSRGNKLRIDADFGGMALVQGHDGEQAWAHQPGQPKPAALEGDQADALAVDAAMNAPWFEFNEPGFTAELAGRETLEGTDEEVWKLLVSGPGAPVQVFLGTEDGLEKKRIARADFGFGMEDTTTTFEDYRDVDGVMVAHRQTTTSGLGDMVLTFDSVEFNAELDPDIFFLPGQAADASLDLAAVLERHLAARGGSASEVQSIHATGTIVMLGFEVPMTLNFARPHSFRADIDLQGLSMVLAYDGETAWTVSPMQGLVEPTPLPEETIGAVSLLSDFLWGMLGDSEARGLEVSFGGVEKVERDDTYRLEIAVEGEMARTLNLGGEDFLERRVVFDGTFLGSTGEVDVTLADYTSVGGLPVPGTIRIAVNGMVSAELRIASAEANAEIDPASFTMPVPADPETPDPAP